MIRVPMLFTTVIQKSNQGTEPENGPFRPELDEGSGRLFWYFFGEAKKYEQWFDHYPIKMLWANIRGSIKLIGG